MSSTQLSGGAATVAAVAMRREAVVMPVTETDRAAEIAERLPGRV